MYQTVSSPLFDIPDFPTLRRVKPLPKRRRTSLNIDPEVSNTSISPGIHSALVSQSHSDSTYIPTYHADHVQSSPRNTTLTSDVLSPVIDAQRSQYDWRLNPDLFLPEEILRVASALPERGSIPGIDNGGGGGDNDGNNEEPFLPPELKTPPLITSETHTMTATPPPPSDTSSYDGESPPLTQTPYRPSYFRSTKQHLIRGRLNLDEQFDPEVTEGELQDRFFLRTETDRLLAHADSLSAKMALRSYYHSIGYSAPELDTSGSASPVPLPPVSSSGVDGSVADYVTTLPDGTVSLDGSVDVNGTTSATTHPAVPGSGYIAVGVGRGHDELDVNGRGGDYTDHLSQQGQGNTKKRKVPANVGNSPPHHHYSSHRGVVGTYGTGSMSYGQAEDGVEGDEREFSFGLGFGLDFGAEATVEDPSSRTMLGGVQSDVFGPLPSHGGAQQQMEPARPPLLPLPPRQFHRKSKLSRATLAGLQRKELVRSRKKQLEAIMGDLPASDSLVLDHALSRTFPPLLSTFSSSDTSSSTSPITDSDHGHSRVGPTFVRTGGKSDENWNVGSGWGNTDGKDVRVRLSRRGRMRAARVARMGLGRLGRHPDAAPFPTGEFRYSLTGATTERLITMQHEVAKLRSLFAAELARQTAKAAEITTGTGKNGGGGGSGKTGKRRAQQRARTIMNAKSGEQQAEFLEIPQKGADHLGQLQTHSSQTSQTQSQGQTPTPKKGKKKKRSTMANASNPHHLRNYVPSRLPHAAGGGGSTGTSHGQGNQTANISSLWPLALKFLSTDLPPRRRKDMNEGGHNSISIQSLPQLVVPQEEWICSFCEYSLFYGEDAEYRRAIRNRKKILKRRRRARERAAAAASGVNAAMKNAAGSADKTQVENEEYDGPGYESMPSNSASPRVDGTGRLRDREPPG